MWPWQYLKVQLQSAFDQKGKLNLALDAHIRHVRLLCISVSAIVFGRREEMEQQTWMNQVLDPKMKFLIAVHIILYLPFSLYPIPRITSGAR
jgi:hypothetical protein